MISTEQKIVTGGAGAVLALLVLMVLFGNDTKITPPNALATPVERAPWSTGTGKELATLTEYGDFQCPACAAYEPVVQQLRKDYGDKLAFVYRQYPLYTIHPHALAAAYASEAAGLQNKFWDMHDILFAKQDGWAKSSNAATLFEGYATELKLDMDKFKTDVVSSAVQGAASYDYAEGEKLGVNSTPTFYLNNEKVVNPGSGEGFKALIDAALKKPAVKK